MKEMSRRWIVVGLALIISFVSGRAAEQSVPSSASKQLEAGGPLRILFIGNSYTGGIRQTLNALVQASPHSGATLAYITPGGRTLQQHLESDKTLAQIKAGPWDFVILQEQSQRPSLPDGRAGFFTAVTALSQTIKASGAQPVLYMTWGRRNSDKQHPHINPDYLTMQQRLTQAYTEAAHKADALIAPVGQAWQEVRQEKPALGQQLYRKDGSHPSDKGALLAACVFYATLFDADPTQLDFNSTLSIEEASYLKGKAKAAVQQQAQPKAISTSSANTDWFRDAHYGVFMHFLPGDAQALAKVKAFDVNTLARQLETVGAKYLVLTLGQNSGFMNAPNPIYNRYTGYAPGERCSTRDLPLDLYRVLSPKGIKLMLYLPCQVPNRDVRAQKAFKLAQGPKDQPINVEFAKKWANVIHDWSARYGDKVAGWWFDGGYEWVGFNNSIARIYADAVKRGNPKAIVTFNPGIKLIRWTEAEDYTAGELTEPFKTIPSSRWVEGSQWHALTYVGSRWSARDTRFPAQDWAQWISKVVAKGGVVTLDMGPNWDPQAGPIGSLADAQIEQGKHIRAALEGR